MTELLVSRAPKDSIALIPVVAGSAYQTWLKKQKTSTQRWLEIQRFKAAPTSFCLVPDGKGEVRSVIVGVSDPISKWDFAALALGLPKGTYEIEGAVSPAALEKLVFGWLMGGYRVRGDLKGPLEAASLYLSAEARRQIDLPRVKTLVEAMEQARDLINLPAEELGPAELADAVVSVAQSFKAKVSQCVGEALLKKGFPATYAMGRASGRPPRFIELTWGHPKNPCVVLTGKGVCFDTGGLNLKTGGGMTLMRKDMGGAACALAVARLIMTHRLPVHLRLLIPTIENAIGGNAIRPSDVVTMRGGLRVQIGNTDAEGRMLLADALTEATDTKALKPDLLVDFSTLGPAAAIFGPYMGMFFTHDESLATLLAEVSQEQEDLFWRMPFHKPYEKMIEASPVADLVNSPSSSNGFGVIAAHFLDRFVKKGTPWIHLDFMAWSLSARPGRPEGAEAMGVAALYALIEKRFAKG